MRRYNIPLDIDDLVRRYNAGESEKALAESLGVSRVVIRRRLVQAGIEPRGRSAAMYQRMADTPPAERAALTEAAHAAVRGVPKTPEFLIAKALGVERKGAAGGNVSPAELALGGMLQDAGLTVVYQKAIGSYNADLTTGTVAMEVLGGQWHRIKSHRERLRYILDAGWDVIYIWVDGRHFPLSAGAAEYVIAHCQFRDRNPAAPRCYRVIRGSGEFLAGGSADSDDLPDILPMSSRPEMPPPTVPPGYCYCGCGQLAPIAKMTRTERGQVKGQPIRFISGHNKSWRRNAS